MNKLLFTTALLVGVAFVARAEPTPFVDVPSCHWATTAINGVVAKDVPAVAKNAATAQNAVRQVFAGMQCGDADWVSRFVDGAPSSLAGIVSQKVVRAFDVTFTKATVNASRASLSFNAVITYTLGARSVTVRRAGTATLTANDETGWRVVYTSLSSLDLPFFPR
jgi:phospholipase/lecithinase/hemolysin